MVRSSGCRELGAYARLCGVVAASGVGVACSGSSPRRSDLSSTEIAFSGDREAPGRPPARRTQLMVWLLPRRRGARAREVAEAIQRSVDRVGGVEIVRQGTRAGHRYQKLSETREPNKVAEPMLVALNDPIEGFPLLQTPASSSSISSRAWSTTATGRASTLPTQGTRSSSPVRSCTVRRSLLTPGPFPLVITCERLRQRRSRSRPSSTQGSASSPSGPFGSRPS